MSETATERRDAGRAARDGAVRRIWLCADDYGIAGAVSAAIRDLLARGRINATSVMVAAPSFRQSGATALIEAAATGGAIGLHVTLSAPFRPLSAGYKPLFADAFPPLWAMAGLALVHALKPELLATEISSQCEAFRSAFGRAPDFVDGHQHIHLFPQIRDALFHVVKEAAPNAWVRQCGRPAAAPAPQNLDSKARVLDWLSRRFRKLAQLYEVRTNPGFAGAYDFRPDADYAALFPAFLDGLPDGGVVMCHPGVVDPELERLDPLTELREREYAFFSDDAFPDLLVAHGVALQRGPDRA